MIHEHGYWISKAVCDTHMIDRSLLKELTYIVKGTCVDIGCGNGAYTKGLRDVGVDCRGFDGSPLTPEISGNTCEVMDFSLHQDIGTFDNVLSLEVGEHIPSKYEQVFINNLARACRNKLILSWAVEGQAGMGHVNCRSNEYVINEMEVRGLKYDERLSQWLRDQSTLPWFKNTLMVFNR